MIPLVVAKKIYETSHYIKKEEKFKLNKKRMQ